MRIREHVSEEYTEQMYQLVDHIDEYLNGDGERRNGFSILIYDAECPARVNYMSNMPREVGKEAVSIWLKSQYSGDGDGQ